MTETNDIGRNKSNDKFYHHFPIQLRFKDADTMGHVNNANHFTYMEIARIQYINDVVTKSNNWKLTGLILAKISIDYIKPILLTNNITAYTRCTRLGAKSFDLEYELRNIEVANELLMATGFSTIVCFNYEKQETIAIPPDWRNKIMEFDHL